MRQPTCKREKALIRVLAKLRIERKATRAIRRVINRANRRAWRVELWTEIDE